MGQSSPATPPAARAVRIEVSADRLSATLTTDPAISIGVNDVIATLTAAGLQLVDGLHGHLSQYLDDGGHVAVSEPLLVAVGVEPIDDTPGHLAAIPIPDDAETGAQTDAVTLSHYERRHFVCVEAGQAVARFTPRHSGNDGVDVHGRPLARRSQPDIRPQLGANVAMDPDGVTVVATAAGRLRLQDNKVAIDPVLTIPGNVDFSTGNVTFGGDIVVRGGILDLFKVSSTRSIYISGSIEAAEVSAGGDLVVEGAILNKNKGQCIAGGMLRCRHAAGSTLTAGGDVDGGTELADCVIHAGGRVLVERGTLFAGHVVATGGVLCQALGSAAQVKTIVEAGADPALRRDAAVQVPEIQAIRARAERVRAAVGPLLRQKSLTVEQKQRAARLLAEVESGERAAAERLEQLRRRHDEYCARAKPQVEVTRVIHAGVVLRFPHAETHITQDIVGAARLVEKQTPQGWQIFLLRPRTGSVIPLPSRAVYDRVMSALVRIVEKQPKQAA